MASSLALLLKTLMVITLVSHVYGSNFYDELEFIWGDGRGQVQDNGQLFTLSLDNISGSAFRSKNEYLFGRIDIQIKLIPGNSAGTVTTFYMSSEGPNHDEIDFEFLGNETGQPYTVHTNVYADGNGNREEQFRLRFDPTTDFHTYSILWNRHLIIFLVDDTPIRGFKNEMKSKGVPFPKHQPMRVSSSLWNADDWATQGGRVKTNWSCAPFKASYRDYNADACVWSAGGGSRCSPAAGSPGTASTAERRGSWMDLKTLDPASLQSMESFRREYMIYSYCSDQKRFPQGMPPECNAS